MASHANENPYLNLSRKALQNLCKESHLPANRSNSHLASSLASYIEGAKLLENCPPGATSKESDFLKDGTTKNSSSNDVGATDVDTGEHCGSLAKAIEEGTHQSMEFHVWSDEGIDLFVDLDASPLHWITRFEDEFCPDNVHNFKSQCFRNDIKEKKSSPLQNVDMNESDDVHYPPSSQSWKDDLAVFVQKLKDDESLTSDSLKSNSSYVKVTDNLEENLSGSSAHPSWGESNYLMSAAESCAKNVSREILDPFVINTQLMKSRCGSTIYTVLDPGKLEKPTSEHSNANPDMLSPGGSLSDFVEPQYSEVASCPKEAAISLCENNQSGVKKEGFEYSSELNLGIDENQVALLVEVSDAGKLHGNESSEYAQFDDPTEKMSSQCFESKQVSCRKRKYLDHADQYVGCGPAPKVLRKKRVREIVHLRRSSRLSLK